MSWLKRQEHSPQVLAASLAQPCWHIRCSSIVSGARPPLQNNPDSDPDPAAAAHGAWGC